MLIKVDVDAYLEDKLSELSDSLKSVKGLAGSPRIYDGKLSYDGVSESLVAGISDSVRDNYGRSIAISYSKGVLNLSYSNRYLDSMLRDVIAQAMGNIKRRLDITNTKDIIIRQEGRDGILLEVPGITDVGYIRRLLGETAKLTFHLLVDRSSSIGLLDYSRVIQLRDKSGTKYLLYKKTEIGGDMLKSVMPGVNRLGKPVIYFKFDAEGSKKFAELTSKNVGKFLAVVLDDEVVTVPVIRERIVGGSGEITSDSFTPEKVKDLSIMLRAGALPAPLKVVQEVTLGPSLGAKSIQQGKDAAIISLVFVVVFVVMAYGFLGVCASIGLLMNVLLTVTAIGLLGITLTLPGIAGIALTVGMSVDANVLIFERIREEIGVGKKKSRAVEEGFDKAMTTILDSNLTTMIAAVIMYCVGGESVGGFAITLSVGIISSLFSAVVFTKVLVECWMRFISASAIRV